MKVLLINGSPHEKGCTYTALSLIAGELPLMSRTFISRYSPFLAKRAAHGALCPDFSTIAP